MEDWKLKIIREKLDAAIKEEGRQFVIAYGELDPKYHGYVSAIPQRAQIWWEEATKDDLKPLQADYSYDRVGAWNGKTYVTTNKPYLGLDGYLAILYDEYEGKVISICPDFHEFAGKLIVEVSITITDPITEKLVSMTEGWVEIPQRTFKNDSGKYEKVYDKDGKPVLESVDVHVSTATRKALHLLGKGRFPIFKTAYGRHEMIEKYREFVMAQKEVPKVDVEDVKEGVDGPVTEY